jgi:hypothetical protein
VDESATGSTNLFLGTPSGIAATGLGTTRLRGGDDAFVEAHGRVRVDAYDRARIVAAAGVDVTAHGSEVAVERSLAK